MAEMDIAPGVLWTAMPMELVTAGTVSQVPACIDAVVDGRLMQVIPRGDGMATVARLLSGDPQDFLNPQWQPGQTVMLP